ncbi:hypothetical protein H0H93_010710, partial [Arthromyces matolae]
MDASRPMIFHGIENVRQEARYLQTVGQFLGWGRSSDNKLFYLVEIYMGQPEAIAQAAGLTTNPEELEKIREDAYQRYIDNYRVIQKWVFNFIDSRVSDAKQYSRDKGNHHNFVYRKDETNNWLSEEVDWGMAELVGDPLGKQLRE